MRGNQSLMNGVMHIFIFTLKQRIVLYSNSCNSVNSEPSVPKYSRVADVWLRRLHLNAASKRRKSQVHGANRKDVRMYECVVWFSSVNKKTFSKRKYVVPDHLAFIKVVVVGNLIQSSKMMSCTHNQDIKLDLQLRFWLISRQFNIREDRFNNTFLDSYSAVFYWVFTLIN